MLRSDDSDEEEEATIKGNTGGGEPEAERHEGEGHEETSSDDETGEESHPQIDLKGLEPSEVINRDITVYYLEGSERVASMGKVVGCGKKSLRVVARIYDIPIQA